LDYIFESEIPTKQHKQFYGELFLQDPPEIPHCVESSLSFGSFATEGCGEGLRTPNMDLPTMKAAKEAIINIMPVHYGETACQYCFKPDVEVILILLISTHRW
jgi:hypothetical protein